MGGEAVNSLSPRKATNVREHADQNMTESEPELGSERICQIILLALWHESYLSLAKVIIITYIGLSSSTIVLIFSTF